MLIRLFLFLTIMLSGCAAFQPTVECNTTVFHVADFKPEGSIMVVAADEKVSSSLEFSYYRDKFEHHLQQAGFTIEHDPAKATYIALVAYGIDNGETQIVTTPIFGQTGGGYFIGRHYIMPSYGVVDVSTQSVTTFTRAIAMDIVLAPSLKTDKVQKLYEGRTKSVGECPVMVEVFDEMLEAMFEGFPGSNATHHKSRIKAVTDC